MRRLPYTDRQIKSFATCDPEWIGEDGHTGYAQEFLMNLRNAGIVLTFPPEPRYYVSTGPGTGWFHVWDRTKDGTDDTDYLGAEATFRGPRAEAHAHEYADALNLDTP